MYILYVLCTYEYVHCNVQCDSLWECISECPLFIGAGLGPGEQEQGSGSKFVPRLRVFTNIASYTGVSPL